MKTMLKFVRLSFARYSGIYLVLFAKTLVDGIFTVFTAYSLSLLIGCVEQANDLSAVKMVVIIVVAEAILLWLRRVLTGCQQNGHVKMEEAVNQMVSEKIMSLPFNYLEDARYMQMKENALMGINNMGAVYDFFQSLLTIVSSLISIAALSVVIFQFDVYLVIILFVGALLAIFITTLSTKTMVKFFNDLLPINFKYGYYLDLLTSNTVCKELRMYSLFQVIEEKFKYFSDEMIHYFMKIMVKESAFNFAVSLVRYVVLAFIYILTAMKTMALQLPISSFTLTCSVAISFSSAVNEIIAASGRFIRAIEYVKPIIAFMEIPLTKNEGSLKLEHFETLEFDHVSFTYPNTNQLVLDQVSFTIKANEKISIVGVNGAGKSTIVKLICMLYRPDQGCIKVNGIDIYQYDYLSYIQHISSIFQDYKLFCFSIKDNIGFEIKQQKALDLLNQVHILPAIQKLKNGIFSNLNKEYDLDGVALSQGQLQKIAIARGLAKNSDFIILDEPTSALDPLAEAEIYENFYELTKGKTAIFISHRMSSSVFCDKILVLQHGKVVDFAPHQELMEKKDGLYYQMFTTQAHNYQLL